MADEGCLYVEFTDTSGYPGRITNDLEVEYDGKHETKIENAVSNVTDTRSDSEDDERRRAGLCDLIIDLPEKTPITSREIHER